MSKPKAQPDLLKLYDDLLQRYCALQAREINNSPLRGYDGLVDENEALKAKLAIAVEALESLGVTKNELD